MVKRKIAKMIAALLTIFIVSVCTLNATGIKTLYTWTYGDKLFSIQYTFDQKAYNFYKNQDRVYSDFLFYLRESPEYPVIVEFSKQFKIIASENKLSDWETVECIIAFIQSMHYQNDGTYEYPRFPLETLVEKGGDCEDTAILLEAILEQMGFDAVLVSPDKHMGVGIALKYAIEGAAFEHRNKYYYYIETTSDGWGIGDYPDHLSANVAIYDQGAADNLRLLSEYVYSFKEYSEQAAQETMVAKDEPITDPAYEFNSASLDADKGKPENKYTIDVDNIIINGAKETMVTEKVTGDNGDKIIATSK